MRLRSLRLIPSLPFFSPTRFPSFIVILVNGFQRLSALQGRVTLRSNTAGRRVNGLTTRVNDYEARGLEKFKQ